MVNRYVLAIFMLVFWLFSKFLMQYFDDICSTIREFRLENPTWVVVIRWTTASWKTALSIALADIFPLEVISADSRQIFRHMDIGTDKVASGIRQSVTHHMIDIIDPDQVFTSAQRQSSVYDIIPQIQVNNKIPIIVWWTGLYIDTIYKNFSIPHIPPNQELRDMLYIREENNPWILHKELMDIDPHSANEIHPKSIRYVVRALEIYHISGYPKSVIMKSHPPRWPILMLWLRKDTQLNDIAIENRCRDMIAKWLIDEVQTLLTMWYRSDTQAMQCIWYKEAYQYISWNIDEETMISTMVLATRRYAKRQRTWLRKYIRDWLEPEASRLQSLGIVHKVFYL